MEECHMDNFNEKLAAAFGKLGISVLDEEGNKIDEQELSHIFTYNLTEINKAKDSLQNYIKSSAPLINQKLRNDEYGLTTDDGLFDILFEFATGYKELYRLLPDNYVQIIHDNSDKIYIDKAYLSCTNFIEDAISHFSRDHTACLQIRISGEHECINVKDIFPNSNDESEIILPRNHKFKLVGKKHYNQKDLGIFIDEYKLIETIESLNNIYKIKSITVYQLEY